MTQTVPQTPASATTSRTLPPLHTIVSGRITGFKVLDKGDNPYLTRVTLPAPDEFSHPQTVEVRSKRRVGQLHEDTKLLVRIGSYRRTFRLQSGETADAIDHTLYVVE